MIVESHAHYAHTSFAGNFRYLSCEDNWELKEGTLEDLLAQMQERGIAMSVEPGIGLDFHEKIFELTAKYPDRIFRRWAVIQPGAFWKSGATAGG